MSDTTLEHIPKTRRPTHVTVQRVLIGLLIVGAIIFASEAIRPYIPKAEAWIQAQGAWAPVVYILLLVLLTIVCFPQDVLWISAGLIFHLWPGFAYVIIGIYIGQSINFWLGRTLFHERVERYADKRPRMRAVNHAIRNEGTKLLFMLRMAPIPASPCSYLMGATPMTFTQFLIANLGLFPASFASMYFGYAAMHAASKTTAPHHVFNTQDMVTFAGLALTIGLMAYIGHRARRVLRAAEIAAQKDGTS